MQKNFSTHFVWIRFNQIFYAPEIMPIKICHFKFINHSLVLAFNDLTVCLNKDCSCLSSNLFVRIFLKGNGLNECQTILNIIQTNQKLNFSNFGPWMQKIILQKFFCLLQLKCFYYHFTCQHDLFIEKLGNLIFTEIYLTKPVCKRFQNMWKRSP